MRKIYVLLIFAMSGLSINAQTNICSGSEICLVINARGDIQWQSSTDSMMTWVDESGAVNDTFCVTPTQNTWYHAYVVEGTCDTIWSDPEYVVINDLPVANAGVDIVGCIGSTVTLGGNPTATGGTAPYTYSWSPSGGLSNPNGANPTYTDSLPGQFILTVTDSLGCISMDTINVDTSGVVPNGTLTFNYSGQIDTFVVPNCVDSLTIEVWGAQGGGGNNNGGKGAYLKGDFAVNSGDIILILVGQQGQVNYGYGGGGGSFVVATDTTPLIIAGGGGGAEHNNSFPGFDAVLTTSGMSIQNAAGGSNGSGGAFGDPNTSGCGWPGGGGGGLLGNGGISGDGGGYAFINGGGGGTDPSGNCVVAGMGGFGGGGSGGNAGGGGGGYSGGAGGANIGLVVDRGGGGGGSINNGVNQTNTAGVQTGNGMITISW